MLPHYCAQNEWQVWGSIVVEEFAHRVDPKKPLSTDNHGASTGGRWSIVNMMISLSLFNNLFIYSWKWEPIKWRCGVWSLNHSSIKKLLACFSMLFVGSTLLTYFDYPIPFFTMVYIYLYIQIFALICSAIDWLHFETAA